MKVLFVGINAKYSHTALAVDYLYEACQDFNVKKLEFNINHQIEHIYGELIREKPDVVGFSTYIWNIDYVRKLTADLAMTTDGVVFWGGPEASYDVEDHFAINPGLDIIVRGEGEVTNRVLLETLEKGGDLREVEGITYRQGEKVYHNKDREAIENLDSIKSPFENIQSDPGKMVYYEMSRGCPFNCSYCLSSAIKGVRYFSFNRIKEDLDHIMKSGTKVVKLVDRTFNANEKFSKDVMDYIVKNSPKGIVFHMELMAHLISDDFLDYLSYLPQGLFQFEIGIQSSNPKTLEAIHRKTNLERLSYVVKKIRSFENIHQHVDLIVGLPYEDYESFKKSFDFAYSLGAEKLQLGFLKVLRGSKMAACVKDHGIQYSNYPPYEVKATKYMSADEVRRLKLMEDLVESYSNEDYFHHSLQYLLRNQSPFDFYEAFSFWWEDQDYHKRNHSRKSLYGILYDYLKDREDIEDLREWIRLDHFIHERSRPEPVLEEKEVKRAFYPKILKDEKVRASFGRDMEVPTKVLLKDFAFGKFILVGEERVYGVDYKNAKYFDITDDYKRIIGERE